MPFDLDSFKATAFIFSKPENRQIIFTFVLCCLPLPSSILQDFHCIIILFLYFTCSSNSFMTSLPSFQAILKGDDHSTFQAPATAFAFPCSSGFFMSPTTNLSNLPPLVQMPLPPHTTFQNSPMLPSISGVQTAIHNGYSHNHSQSGFWSGECCDKPSLFDQALQQRIDVVTPPTEDTFEIIVSQDDEVRASLQSNQFVQQNQSQGSLLQKQQKEVRERMEYLSSLLRSPTTPGAHTEVPKWSRKLSVATIEGNLISNEQLPAKKKQRADTSSKQELEKRFRTYQADQWNEKFDDLVRFKNKFRHCCVPHSYSGDPTLVGQSKKRLW
jgi:hypothetical protein